jgi:hypothetical protein
VLTTGAAAKLNKEKACPKAAIHIAVIIVRMLARHLQTSANVVTRVANKATTGWRPQNRHPIRGDRQHDSTSVMATICQMTVDEKNGTQCRLLPMLRTKTGSTKPNLLDLTRKAIYR